MTKLTFLYFLFVHCTQCSQGGVRFGRFSFSFSILTYQIIYQLYYPRSAQHTPFLLTSHLNLYSYHLMHVHFTTISRFRYYSTRPKNKLVFRAKSISCDTTVYMQARCSKTKAASKLGTCFSKSCFRTKTHGRWLENHQMTYDQLLSTLYYLKWKEGTSLQAFYQNARTKVKSFK